jgi:hypothetical protein
MLAGVVPTFFFGFHWRGVAAAPRGGQVQQPPLLLRLLPLPVMPGPGERRVHRQGVVGGDEVLEGPR